MGLSVTVKLFAGLAETIGHREVALDLPASATVKDLKTVFVRLYPGSAGQIEHCLVAVNRTYKSDNQPVLPAEEIALIPPVGGGSPEADPRISEALPSCLVTEDELNVDAAFKQLESVYCGGTVIFCGTVREFTRGRQTKSLTYEAYIEMAEQKMREIEQEVKNEWPGVETIQWHRIGHLWPTDIAVICAAASPHRDTAFAAARALIERLKQQVPIWKKEFYADGDSDWQPNES